MPPARRPRRRCSARSGAAATPTGALAWGPAASVPLLEGRPLIAGLPTAYVCEGFVCRAPVTDPEELAAQLAAADRPT